MTPGGVPAATVSAPVEHESQAAADRAPDTSILIASKLTVPPPHEQSIRRLRIERKLSAGTRRKLTLVVAPAGYGKTTLVTNWLAALATQATWVSLDEQDNTPTRFWTYLLAALARTSLGVLPAPNADDRLTMTSNALADLSTDLVVVLDDYHLITSPDIHRDLAFLIEQHLPRLHLFLLCRSDPLFVQARWKANGEVTEIRVHDLAFTDEETALFLDDQDVQLEPGLRRLLTRKIGGWAAALRLVTVWMSARSDAEQALAEFASSDATIADYLVSEVLNQLPDSTRTFLLRTSVLPRLTGPLCDAVISPVKDSSGDAEQQGTQTLWDLHRRDLFVQAMDSGHHVFRYHPLFGELLRLELHRSDPGIVPELHRRAARWFAAHEFTEDAIAQGILAEDWSHVRTLMLSEILAIGVRYQPSVVSTWLSSLPQQILADSPFFLLLQGYVQATMGDTRLARRTLAQVRVRASAADADPDLPEVTALAHAIQAGIARLECDLAATRAAGESARAELARLPAPAALGPMVTAVADTALIGALFWTGDIAAAEELVETTERDAAVRGLERMRVNAASSRALILAAGGRLRESTVLIPAVLRGAEPIGVSASFQTTPTYLARAIVSMQRGLAGLALEQLKAVSNQALQHGDRGPFLAASTLSARLLSAGGDTKAAFTILDNAVTKWPGWTPPASLQATLLAEQARLSLAVGDHGAARTIEAQLSALPQNPTTSTAFGMTRARLMSASGDPTAAAAQFRAVADSVADRDLLTYVEALVGAAVAKHGATQPTDAQRLLTQAMAAAQSEGIIAPFVWHADAMRPLLMKIDLGTGDFAGTGFRLRLLDELGLPARSGNELNRFPPTVAGLSERELTVVRMLRGTLTNAEIASALSISPNTLKSHVRNINRKLGADNRQQLLARAKELELR